MIKLTIFGFLLVCAMSAWFPDYDWLTIPIFVAVALIWLAAKILRSLSGPNPPENRKDPVIGAGSVVTHDIPAGVVAVGSPCRVLRKITEADRVTPV
mgnify:CR=1 FL=1